MTDKLMYIPNDDTQNYPYVNYNKWLKCFEHLKKLMNQPIKIQLKSPRLLSQQKRKRYN